MHITVKRRLGYSNLFSFFFDYFFSINHYYVLRIQLKSVKPFPNTRKPPGKLNIANKQDMNALLGDTDSLDSKDKRELLARLAFHYNGLLNCYLFRANDAIAYLQWLVYPSENNNVIKHCGTRFFLSTGLDALAMGSFLITKS